MRRPVVLALAAAGAVALPGTASADVPLKVPTPFLGGPIWTPLPAVSPEAPGRPSLAPPTDACVGSEPPSCTLVGPEAEVDAVPLPTPGPGGVGVPVDDVGVETDPPPDDDTPVAGDQGEGEGAGAQEAPATPAVPPSAESMAAAYGGLLHPGPADWLAWQRPTLRWRPQAGATHYNVQVFRGQRRVLNAWARGARLRVPDGVLRQGRAYVWTVWPAWGPRAARRFGPPVGRSTFAVTLRPRIVFRRPGGRGGTVGEVRPHIPYATIRLSRPRALAARVPRRVRLDRRGRFVLSIPSRAAERLDAVLMDRGPTPPVGLRGPGL